MLLHGPDPLRDIVKHDQRRIAIPPHCSNRNPRRVALAPATLDERRPGPAARDVSESILDDDAIVGVETRKELGQRRALSPLVMSEAEQCGGTFIAGEAPCCFIDLHTAEPGRLPSA